MLATADSETYPAAELDEARRLAERSASATDRVQTHELEHRSTRATPPNRCFFCKDELFTRLEAVAREHGGMPIVYGAIMDDLGDHRPGMEAAKAKGVRAPLIEAELWKARCARSAGAGAAQLGQALLRVPVLPLPVRRPHHARKAPAGGPGRSLSARAGVPPVPRAPPRAARPPRAAAEEMAASGRRVATPPSCGGFRQLGYHFVDAGSPGFRSGSANEALRWIGKK